MKSITVPELAKVKYSVFNRETGVQEEQFAPFEFKTFLESVVLVDPKFGKDMKTIMTAVRLRDKFKEANPGDVVEVSDEDYSLLKSVVEEPTNGYNPQVMLQMVHYLTALTSA
jgi:hypothetical protein